MKTCTRCLIEKPLNEFTWDVRNKGYQSRCKACRVLIQGEYQRSDKAKIKHRRAVMKYRYNITPEMYDSMLEAQGGVCGICGTEEHGTRGEFFCIDHDHACCAGDRSCGECVRGLLCLRCNNNLGWWETHRVPMTEYLYAHANRKGGTVPY